MTICINRTILVFLCLASALFNPMAKGEPQNSNVKPGKSGLVDMLFLRGNVEIGFGQPIPIDPEYLSKLEGAGYRVTVARDFNPLTLEYLRQFNTVVWINPSPFAAGSRYFGPDSWQGGLHMLTVKRNAEILRDYVSEGGGLLINPAIEEIGMPVSESHNELLKVYGIQTDCAQVRDKKHEVEFDRISKNFPIHVSWTEAMAEHPVNKGVRRIYYPAYTMRWDDNVTTMPLYPRDPAWIPFVKAMPEATASWYRGTPYENGHWKDAEGRETPSIVAGRDYQKGRVAVISICHFHLFYFPYGDKKQHCECYFGAQEGKLMEKGFDGVPSDLSKLLDNLYRWLAEPGTKLGFGAYDEKTGVKLAEIPQQPVSNVSEVWADKDPMNTGTVRPMKIMVGARSGYSGGKGSVKEYAEAGKKAGIDVIAFTETFENMNDADFIKFVGECKKYSDKDIFLLPGLDIEDKLGNRFLLLGKNTPVRAHLLVEKEADQPGKKLIWTGHMLLGMGEVLPVAAQPKRLDTLRESGRLPPDLYSHCPGVAVATYRGDKKIDDGLFAYEWQLFNASIPIPVAVHEVYSPEELGVAARTGLQSYVNADTPEHAAFYFRQGHMSAGGNPMRYYVSSGPLIDSAGIDNWQSEHWTITVKARDDHQITDLEVFDQLVLYRHFKPDKKEISESWTGNLGRQQWFLIKLKDNAGGEAFLSPLRTLPERHFVRCLDRQNWFGNLNFKFLTYTGRVRSLPATGATITLPGITLPADPCPRLQMKYIGPGYTVTDYIWDMTLVPGSAPTGADSAPMFNSLPNEFYDGRIRHVFYSTPGIRSNNPEIIQPVIDIRLLRKLKSSGPVWPIIGKAEQVKPGSPFISSSDGKNIEGTMPKGGYVDLAAGGSIGNIVALSPLRVSDKGLLGFSNPVDGAEFKEGTQYHAEYILADPKNISEIRKAIGFDGPLPFKMELRQGRLEKIELKAFCIGENYGIAGTVKGCGKECWWNEKRQLPLWVEKINRNWPVGLWNAESGKIQSFGVFEGTAMGAIDVSRDSDFYFGNLLIASDERIRLGIASEWDADKIRIEVHNPSNEEISATITSPKAVTGRKAVNVSVKLAPGKTDYIEVR